MALWCNGKKLKGSDKAAAFACKVIRIRGTGLLGGAAKGRHHVKARLAQALLDDKFPPKRISTLVKQLCDAVPQEATQSIFAEDGMSLARKRSRH